MEKIKRTPCIIVHGGAWSMPDNLLDPIYAGIQEAVKTGYEVLKNGGSSVEAVEKAVNCMENNHCFNAGHGAVLNEIGKVECDAMIMNGSTLNSGAVMAVSQFSNPVSLARQVMEKTPHCAFNVEGSLAFANKIGYPVLKDPTELVTETAMQKGVAFDEYETAVHSHIEGHDTVGAVAMDTTGCIACATSTGGIPAKMQGRIGDSPMIGCGGYANEFGGCSTTGHGESIMKMTLAREVVYSVENGNDAQVSSEKAVQRMYERIEGYGGVIVVDKDGNFGKAFNTQRMSWALIKDNVLQYGIEPNECNQVDLS
ncbi:isoaspartyl peptidase/L-asparaginase-like [Dendronephthya gigantea]|uniref:isoaspartyl peptidase/L-asparaginase-like n=1 Tax=Dendronephthya gigantea TaxID=151771 RepID=UPI00106BDDEC|nr:isoaspartyl peptidase/L-asparaginase-like [Dendronephthya gigantea]